MSKCLLCGSCVEKCPNEVPTDEIVIAAREALAAKRGLTTFHTAVGQVIKNRSRMRMGARMAALLGPLFFRKVPETSGLRLRFPLPFVGNRRHIPVIAKKPFMERHPEVIPGEPGKPRIVFFVGCMTNFVYTEIGEAALALFRHLGCTVIIPKGQQCCGLPGMSGGDADTVRDLAEMNLAEMERYEADFVMTACATCGGALHRLYPLVVGKRRPELRARLDALAAKTVDASQLLLQLGLNPAETGAGDAIRITYHDPCHLRTRGLTKQPRTLLKAVPGVELTEMEGADRCCGLGGTFNVYHYGSSMTINEAKSRAIIKTAAKAVATGCPGCMMQLDDGLKHSGSKVEVLHTLQLLARRLKI
jgi:glycolate oxidase iron-sulfur subunit